MKNLILAVASILLSGQLHAGIVCPNGMTIQVGPCPDFSNNGFTTQPLNLGLASDDISLGLGDSLLLGGGASLGGSIGSDESQAPMLEEITVTGRADHSRLCDSNTVITINSYMNQERENYGYQSCISNKQAANDRIDYNALPNRVGPPMTEEVFLSASAMKAVDCEAACPSSAPAPDEEGGPATGAAGYVNGGRPGQMGNFEQAPQCLQELQRVDASCNPQTVCQNEGAGECAPPTNGVTRFKPLGGTIDFEDYNSCKTVLGQTFAEEAAAPVANAQLKAMSCRIVASACSGAYSNQTDYNTCVSTQAQQQLRSVVVGIQKCAAIKAAANGTTQFDSGEKVSSIDGKITCKKNSAGLHFDYPSCSAFVGWYNGIVATQAGVQMYNEGDKISTGMRAQNEAATAIASGNGQEAGVEASRKTIMASASAEERNKFFFIAKGAAITAQLATFVSKSNIGSHCEGNENCCALFDADRGDEIRNASAYFPNGSEKDKMIAEVIRAGGEAALAAMKEQELRRQAAALRAIKEQMTAPDDVVDEGLMRFCLQFPQDSKCLGAGNRVISGGSGFRGPSFSGQNMGLGNLGTATSEDINVEDGAASAIGGPQNSVGNIGSADKGAAEAKATFDAPSALKGGGGSPTISGGGGGGGANASANGLSNDPGVEGEKKETPLKMTSKSATYEGGAGYNGGGYRAGAGDKKDAAANPFASMFGKDKGRSPSAVPEIDSPASDLFTKISNRYGEVQKRKALMDVR